MSESLVESILAAVDAGNGAIEVAGDGALGRALTARAGIEVIAAGRSRPTVVIETSGAAESVRAALVRVADLGTVVLAGPLNPSPPALDLYADVHVRGLTIMGLPPQPSPDAGAT